VGAETELEWVEEVLRVENAAILSVCAFQEL
jgi:hypothetical protein